MKISDVIKDLAASICELLGGRVPERDDDTFFEAMHAVLTFATHSYRPSLAYQILVFFFGHTTAHIILVRFHEFMRRRNRVT